MPIIEPAGGGGGGAQPVLVATVALSSAEILALDSTPKTLVAGVPAKVILPVLFLGSITPGGTPYSDNPVGRVFLGPTFGASGFGASLLTPILGLTATTPHMGTVLSPFSDASEATSACVGQPLRLDLGSAVTDGDCTATVSVLYVLIDS